MALIFSDAMDSHGVTANLADTYNNVSGDVTYQSTGGRFGGGAIQAVGNSASFSKSFSDIQDLYVSFALHMDIVGGVNTGIRFVHTGGTMRINNVSSGLWEFSRDGVTVIATVPVTAGAWNWFSIHLRAHATVGRLEVKINGIQLVNFTGNTLGLGTADTINAMQFGGGDNGLGNATYIWDDIIVTNGLGGSFDGLLNDRRIETIRPNGVGTATNFAPFPSDGVNWNKVDEATPDDDTTYVEDAVSAQRDTYTHTNMTLTPASIDGLVVKTLAKNPDGGSNNIKHVIDSNGTVSVGSALGTTSDYLVTQTLFEDDPDTGVAWIKAGVDAVEAGFEVS